MKDFEITLDIAADFLNKVLIQTADQKLGEQLYRYISQFHDQEIIAVKVEDSYHFLDTAAIIRGEIFDKELMIVTKDQEVTARMTLKELKEKLNPAVFVQVSKSVLINIKEITRLEVAFSGNYYAFMSNGDKVTVSRRFIRYLKESLDI